MGREAGHSSQHEKGYEDDLYYEIPFSTAWKTLNRSDVTRMPSRGF